MIYLVVTSETVRARTNRMNRYATLFGIELRCTGASAMALSVPLHSVPSLRSYIILPLPSCLRSLGRRSNLSKFTTEDSRISGLFWSRISTARMNASSSLKLMSSSSGAGRPV
ncbi:hypothetical protein CY34DRAFT_478320 [Suillus luteus UH-Slu-Lm8-n1]|uniref:Uncharacterized protein n=1 Tax=Suillus luteus UH-Slu-Lm8-n1 TaxID=930992 RepID=A0A0D0AZ02_9AGAM|nr:hypothetical protein CY34DRAFT_478320 [Suillus luteus UH-Slu-Lm8-n1]